MKISQLDLYLTDLAASQVSFDPTFSNSDPDVNLTATDVQNGMEQIFNAFATKAYVNSSVLNYANINNSEEIFGNWYWTGDYIGLPPSSSVITPASGNGAIRWNDSLLRFEGYTPNGWTELVTVVSESILSGTIEDLTGGVYGLSTDSSWTGGLTPLGQSIQELSAEGATTDTIINLVLSSGETFPSDDTYEISLFGITYSISVTAGQSSAIATINDTEALYNEFVANLGSQVVFNWEVLPSVINSIGDATTYFSVDLQADTGTINVGSLDITSTTGDISLNIPTTSEISASIQTSAMNNGAPSDLALATKKYVDDNSGSGGLDPAVDEPITGVWDFQNGLTTDGYNVGGDVDIDGSTLSALNSYNSTVGGIDITDVSIVDNTDPNIIAVKSFVTADTPPQLQDQQILRKSLGSTIFDGLAGTIESSVKTSLETEISGPFTIEAVDPNCTVTVNFDESVSVLYSNSSATDLDPIANVSFSETINSGSTVAFDLTVEPTPFPTVAQLVFDSQVVSLELVIGTQNYTVTAPTTIPAGTSVALLRTGFGLGSGGTSAVGGNFSNFTVDGFPLSSSSERSALTELRAGDGSESSTSDAAIQVGYKQSSSDIFIQSTVQTEDMNSGNPDLYLATKKYVDDNAGGSIDPTQPVSLDTSGTDVLIGGSLTTPIGPITNLASSSAGAVLETPTVLDSEIIGGLLIGNAFDFSSMSNSSKYTSYLYNGDELSSTNALTESTVSKDSSGNVTTTSELLTTANWAGETYQSKVTAQSDQIEDVAFARLLSSNGLASISVETRISGTDTYAYSSVQTANMTGGDPNAYLATKKYVDDNAGGIDPTQPVSLDTSGTDVLIGGTLTTSIGPITNLASSSAGAILETPTVLDPEIIGGLLIGNAFDFSSMPNSSKYVSYQYNGDELSSINAIADSSISKDSSGNVVATCGNQATASWNGDVYRSSVTAETDELNDTTFARLLSDNGSQQITVETRTNSTDRYASSSVQTANMTGGTPDDYLATKKYVDDNAGGAQPFFANTANIQFGFVAQPNSYYTNITGNVTATDGGAAVAGDRIAFHVNGVGSVTFNAFNIPTGVAALSCTTNETLIIEFNGSFWVPIAKF